MTTAVIGATGRDGSEIVRGALGGAVSRDPFWCPSRAARRPGAPPRGRFASRREDAAAGAGKAADGAAGVLYQGFERAAFVIPHVVRVRAAEIRGGQDAATLQPLFTAPLAATTYKDTTAQAGMSYTYAIYALDRSVPPNASQPSERQTVTVR